MNNTIKLSITLLILSTTLLANELPKNDLKNVMKNLLTETLHLTEAIVQSDYLMIEKSAHNIANHPAANMATKKKLMMGFGLEMIKFKSYDSKVHQAAVNISQASKEEDMPKVMNNYNKLIQGCQNCHNKFRKRVIKILGEQ